MDSVTRRRRRASERGTALFVVVLVTTLLSAIGVFAVRTISLVDSAAGFARKAAQTTYVTEFAVRSVASEVSSRPDWLKAMMRGDDPTIAQESCRATEAYKLANPGVRIPCKNIDMEQVRRWVHTSAPGTITSEPANEGWRFPGAQSRADWFDNTGNPNAGMRNEAHFNVEITDFGPAPTPEAGYDLSSRSGFQFYQVAFTATGQVRPVPPGSGVGCDPNTVQASGIQRSRAYVTFRARK